MSKPEPGRWRRTSPLAIISYIGRTLEMIARNAVQSFAPLIALFFAFEGSVRDRLAFAITAGASIVVLLSILHYLFFRYQVGKDSVLIRSGVLKRSQVDIKFDRVQAINTEQNIVYRLFGLVTIKLDTAGSSGKEGILPAIDPETARVLRDRIRQERQDDTGGNDGPESSRESPGNPEPILALGNMDMIRIGLSDNRALIFLAFLGPLFERAGNIIESLVDETKVATDAVRVLDSGIGISIPVILIAVLLCVLAIASIGGAFLRFHKFRLVEESGLFQSNSGLLTRHVHSINRKKIQSVVARQNIMHRLFSRFRITARQASSSRKESSRNHFEIPLCERSEMLSLTQQLVGHEQHDIDMDPRSSKFHPIATQYLRSRILLVGILPGASAALALAFTDRLAAAVVLLWIPLVALWAWQTYRRYGVQVSVTGLALRRGFLGFRISNFLFRKVQRVSVTQSAPQRRKGLATLRFFLASGTIRVPFIDYDRACQLRDFVLYRVETSRQAWH